MWTETDFDVVNCISNLWKDYPLIMSYYTSKTQSENNWTGFKRNDSSQKLLRDATNSSSFCIINNLKFHIYNHV